MTVFEKKALVFGVLALAQALIAAWVLLTPPNHPAAGRRHALAVVLALSAAALLIAAFP